MTDKEAIEILKKHTKDYLPEYTETMVDGKVYRTEILQLEPKPSKKICNAIDTILLSYEVLCNELDKKNKEITKLKSHNKDLLRKLRNRIKEINKLNKYKQYKNEFKTLNKKIEELNRENERQHELLTKIHEKSILKQKIQEKIDELENKINKGNIQKLYEYTAISYSIDMLQKILEGEDE